jgi:hypothetical protein
MGIKSTGILDESGVITNTVAPILLGARLLLEDDTEYLDIYDNILGPEYGKVIIHLDRDVPFMMFDKLDAYHCNDGIYAYLPEGGSFIVYYDV